MNLLEQPKNRPGSHESFESYESVLPWHRNRAGNESSPALQEGFEL